MNSNNKINITTSLLITSIFLAITLLSGSISVGNVYATGGLDDEEEEEAIENLQNEVTEINETIGKIALLNLQEGANSIQANCPSTDEIVEEIEEVIENVTEEQQPQPENTTTTTIPECPTIPEQNNNNNNNNTNQTVVPPIVIPPEEPEEPEEPITCEPIPEPEENNNQTVVPPLEPITCPTTGELLGYKNVTSGELLPISAGAEGVAVVVVGNETGATEPFIPPTSVIEGNGTDEGSGNETSAEVLPVVNQTSGEPIGNAEYNATCYCFVLNEESGELNATTNSTEATEASTTSEETPQQLPPTTQ